MVKTILIVGTIYLMVLISLGLRARSRDKSSKQYLMAGSNLGAFLGFFTFAATLFSTFTLLGMPDFFRVHGIGAWIFLAVSDAVMVFGIIWIGYGLRKHARGTEYYGMAGFIGKRYGSSLAGITTFLGAFIFLIPYVAIQIRGVSIFLNAAFPHTLPIWVWAISIVIIMLIYSEIGGLKAIIYNDVFQGVLLLLAIWIVALVCLNRIGGIENMFTQVAESNPKLLSVPGPEGLLTIQFLLGSTLVIALLPYTQPQISTRIIILKNIRALFRMAIGLGIFAIVIILPTMILGMYGAVHYSADTTQDFLGKIFLYDQATWLGALLLIGLIAAAISTSDSQIFALGSEVRSLLRGEDRKMVTIARFAIILFALLSFVFAVLSSDELVLLARTSFAGTSLMAPMILLGIFHSNPGNFQWLPLCTAAGIVVLICSQLGWVPHFLLGLRTDLFLLIALASLAGGGLIIDRVKSSNK